MSDDKQNQATPALAVAPCSAAWDPAATPGCHAISEAALREYNDLGSGFVAFVPGGRGQRRINDCVEYTLKELSRLREVVRTVERELENQMSHEWGDKIGERDHLIGALRAIQRCWQRHSEACADNSHAGEVMVEIARHATEYLDSPNVRDEPRHE